MNNKTLAMLATLTIGCTGTIPSVQRNAKMVIKPSFSPGSVRGQAAMPAYDRASIHHLAIRLFQGAYEIASKSILNAQLDNPTVFSNLKPNTTYHLKGYAYSSADDSVKISDDASSSLEIQVESDDRPTMGTLTVALIARLFNGQASSSLTIISGGYSPIGSESLMSPVIVSTVAGSGTAGSTNGIGTSASFNTPYDVAADAQGNVYVADTLGDQIRKITPGGYVSTLAGGTEGYLDGTGTQARLNAPVSLSVDASGNVYFIDDGNRRIRKVTPSGVVSTLAGSGTLSFADGTGTLASFYFPYGIAVDAQGNVYVGDGYNNRIRKIDQNNVVTTYAGDGTDGCTDGARSQARFSNPNRIAMGAGRYLYVIEPAYYKIRKIDTQTEMVSTLAGDGTQGAIDGIGSQARFYSIDEVAADDQGNVYVLDNKAIRKIDSNGRVTTLAGSSATGYLDGTGTNALFNNPFGLGADPFGNLFVSEKGNHRIRKIQ